MLRINKHNGASGSSGDCFTGSLLMHSFKHDGQMDGRTTGTYDLAEVSSRSDFWARVRALEGMECGKVKGQMYIDLTLDIALSHSHTHTAYSRMEI